MREYEPNESLPYATVVKGPDSRPTKSRNGCLIAAFAGIAGLFFLALIGLIIWTFVSSMDRQPFVYENWYDIQESLQNTSLAKEAAEKRTDPTSHPEYERIVRFVDEAQSALDDTPNPRLPTLIDLERYTIEVVARSKSLNSHFARIAFKSWLKKYTIGPSSFSEYEIVAIQPEDKGGFRVYLNYSTGYSYTEPHVWFLHDVDGRMMLYDWCQLDLGLRSSAEDAIIQDASLRETDGYNEYVELNERYYNSDSYSSDGRQESRQALAECENFSGPSRLKDMVFLITARRWHLEGESQRALDLLTRIINPNTTPGVYRLRGMIYSNREEHVEALASYQQYIDELGPQEAVLDDVASCHRYLGNAAEERSVLLSLCTPLANAGTINLAKLIELNSIDQNAELFANIDASDTRDTIYQKLISWFQDSEFYADKLEEITNHVDSKWPDSIPAKFARMASDANVEDAVAILNWIQKQPADQQQSLRYDFWYELDETMLLKVLKSSPDMEQAFDTICECYEYDEIVADSAMLEICEFVRSKQPNNFDAIFFPGAIKLYEEDYDAAIKFLTEAKDHPDASEREDQITWSLISAHYEAGDHESAAKMADSESSALHLLSLKSAADDFTDFDALLSQVSDLADTNYYRSLQLVDQEKLQQAETLLSQQVIAEAATSEQDENYYGYGYGSRCSNLLIELCRDQGDVLRAYQLAPTQSMLQALSTDLADNWEWDQLDRLIELAKQNGDQNGAAALRFNMLWQQGKYKELLDQPWQQLSNNQTVEGTYEKIVRAAIRTNSPQRAMQYAQQAEFEEGRGDLVALVALVQKNDAVAVEKLKQLLTYQRLDVYRDIDLRGVDWRPAVQSSGRLLERGTYYWDSAEAFEYRLWFDRKKEWNVDALSTLFRNAIGDNFQVTSLSATEPESGWLVENKDFRLLVGQQKIDYSEDKDPGFELSENLKLALRNSKVELTVIGIQKQPATNQRIETLATQVLLSLANENLQAASRDYMFLPAEEIFSYREQQGTEVESGVHRPFGPGKREGTYGFVAYPSGKFQFGDYQEFNQELTAAIKRFESSQATEKRMLIQTSYACVGQGEITVRLNGVRRLDYGNEVELTATVEQESPYAPSLKVGDKVSLDLIQANSFRLQIGNDIIERDRSQR